MSVVTISRVASGLALLTEGLPQHSPRPESRPFMPINSYRPHNGTLRQGLGVLCLGGHSLKALPVTCCVVMDTLLTSLNLSFFIVK